MVYEKKNPSASNQYSDEELYSAFDNGIDDVQQQATALASGKAPTVHPHADLDGRITALENAPEPPPPSEWINIKDKGGDPSNLDNLSALYDCWESSPFVHIPDGIFDIALPGIDLPDNAAIRGVSRHHSVLRWRNPEDASRTLLQTGIISTTTTADYTVAVGGGSSGTLNVADASKLPDYGSVRLYMNATDVTVISYGYKVGNSLRDCWAAEAGITGTFPSGSTVSGGPRLLKNFQMRDITIDGGIGSYIVQGQGPGNSMFLLWGFEDISLERVIAQNSTGYGVGFQGGPPIEASLSHNQKRQRRLWVDQCMFINNGWNASGDPHDGFDIKWAQDVMLSRTGAIRNADQGIDMRGRNIVEQGCWAEGQGAEGFSFDNGQFRDYRAVNSRLSTDTYIRISNATHITAGDIINVGGTNEKMLVTHDPQPFADAPDPLSSKQIKVRRGVMGTTAQAIGAGAFLTVWKVANMRAIGCSAFNNGIMNYSATSNDGFVIPENFGLKQVLLDHCNSHSNRGRGFGIYDANSAATGSAQATVVGGDYSFNGGSAIYALGSASGRGRRSLMVNQVRAVGNGSLNAVEHSNWIGSVIGTIDVPAL